MFKKENVVLLPTNQKAGCIIKTSDNVLVYQQNPYLVEGETLNHLYFTSNEEIKEGDYLLVEEHLKPLKFRYYMSNGDIECNNGLAYINEKCKKIIATTDTYLKIPDFPELENTAYRNLPQPSQGFINIFIEEYNKGNIIETVLIEYEEY